MSPQGIQAVYVILLALAVTVGLGLTLVNMRHLSRLRSVPPEGALALMDREQYRTSVDYTCDRGRLSIVSTAVDAGVLLLLTFTGWLGQLEQGLSRLSPRLGPSLTSVIFVYACALLFALASLPFSLYSQFAIEARYGFNRTSWRLWAIDALKGLGVGLVLLTPLLYGLFILVRATPRWWLWAFAGFAAVQLAMLYLFPKLIAPLFNRYTPLEDGSLKQRVYALAERLGVHTRGICVVDGSRRSSHSNAYFSGIGRAKRIVLFDTLIRTLSEAQIVAVLAHEIGHQKRRHVMIRIAVSLAVSAVAFWGLSRLAGYPPLFAAFGFPEPSPAGAVVLIVYFAEPLSLLLRPLTSWWSRRQEFEADRFARDLAGEGRNLSGALATLSRDNLSNPTPHPWYSFLYYSHPPVLERIRALERPAIPS